MEGHPYLLLLHDPGLLQIAPPYLLKPLEDHLFVGIIVHPVSLIDGREEVGYPNSLFAVEGDALEDGMLVAVVVAGDENLV